MVQETARTRPRSRPHPKANAEECLRFAQVVRRYGGALSVHDYASELGHTSPTQGAAIPKISSPQYFGFLTRDQGTLRGTDLLDRLSAPISQEEEQAARLEAINNVEIYGELFAMTGRSGEKRMVTVRNMAQRQLGIVAAAASEFVDVFVESIEWAGVGRRIDDDRFELYESGTQPTSAQRIAGSQRGSEEIAEVVTQSPAQADVSSSQTLMTEAPAATSVIHLHLHINSGDPANIEALLRAATRALREVSPSDTDAS